MFETKVDGYADVKTVEKTDYDGGATPLGPPTVDIPEFEGGVVLLDSPIVDKPELKIPGQPTSEPMLEPEPTPEVLGKPVVTAQVKRLANTGSETSNAAVLGFGALIAGIALVVRKRQNEK